MAVGFGMLDKGEVMLYLVTGKETSKLLVNELNSVISHHGIRYLKASEDIPLDELSGLRHLDGG